MRLGKGIAWLLLAALLFGLCTGCGTPPVTVAGNPEEETAQTAPETKQEEKLEEPVDYMALYAPVLDEAVELIQNGYGEKDYRYASNGVMEVSMWGKAEEMLQAIGYTLEDVSGDGVPELFIGYVPNAAEPKESNELFGGYTWKDGAPFMFVEGWARNRNLWMGGNRFFNAGSAGAAHSAFGTFRLSEDATEQIWEDFWFSDDVPPSSVDITNENYVPKNDLWYYHNTSGTWEREDSEEFKVAADEFWKLCEDDMALCVQMEMTPLAEYAAEHPVSPYKVTAAWFDDAGLREGEYEDELELYPNIFQNAPYDTKVVFRAKERVKEFNVLSLELQDVDESGHANYKTEPLLMLYTLEADEPIAVPMSFPGDIPTNGISYLGENEEPLLFTLGISGRDGSLELLPVK